MTDSLKVVPFTLSLDAAGNTQDITFAGSVTPSAAMFIVSGSTIKGYNFAHARMSIGFTDGVNERATTIMYKDGATESDCNRGQVDKCIAFVNAAAGPYLEFSFNSWINSGGNAGVRLNIDDSSAGGYYGTAIFFIGDVANAKVGSKDDLLNVEGTVDVEVDDVGFEPDLVFITHVGLNIAVPDYSTYAIHSFGAAINNLAETNKGLTNANLHSVTTTSLNQYLYEARFGGQLHGGTHSWYANVKDFDADGFTVQVEEAAGDDIIHYLALKFDPGVSVDLFNVDIPTSGDYVESSMGFQPDFGLLCVAGPGMARNTAVKTESATFHITAFDANEASTVSHTSAHGVTTTVEKSQFHDDLVIVRPSDLVDDGQGSLSSFDSGGWTFNLTSNPSAITRGWGLAIGYGSGATTHEASISFGQSLSAEQGKTAVFESDVAIASVLDVAEGLSRDIEAALAVALAASASASATQTVEASLPIAQALELAGLAQADQQAQLGLIQSVGIEAISIAILNAGLTLTSITSITVSETTINLNLTTPEGRTIIVDADLRSFKTEGSSRMVQTESD